MEERRVLIYDGDCPFCLAVANFLVKRRILPPDRVQPHTSLPLELALKTRNELLVIDRENSETRQGVEGLIWALEDRFPLLKLLKAPLPLCLLTHLYRTISYNRRILFPRSDRFICACDPDFVWSYWVSLIAFCSAFATLVTGAFGAVVWSTAGLGSPLEGALRISAIAGSGWIVLFVASLFLPEEKRTSYLGHLATTMLIGVLILTPSILLSPVLPTEASLASFLLSVIFSFSIMLRWQKRRIRGMGISEKWLVLWIVSLLGGATSSILLLSGG